MVSSHFILLLPLDIGCKKKYYNSTRPKISTTASSEANNRIHLENDFCLCKIQYENDNKSSSFT